MRRLGIIIILGMSVFFAVRAIENSRVKNFWNDETYGLEVTARQATYQQLLTSGARGQGSAAPLDYIFIKSLDLAYPSFFSNIPHNIYYRLNSIFWDFTGGMLVFLLFFGACYRQADDDRMVMVQLLLICFAMLAFYFKKDNMLFSIQMRPYALWNSLWFVMLGLVMLRGLSVWVLLAGILLALTSNGALIQIPALAFSQLIVRSVGREGFLKIGGEIARILLLPFLIAVYYALHADKFGYVRSLLDHQNYLHQFHAFWLSKWRTLVLSGAGVLLTIWNRQRQGCAIVFLTMLFLYCMAPAVNDKILSSNFFFTNRQYLYFDLVFPLFYLMLALTLPEYWNMIRIRLNKKG